MSWDDPDHTHDGNASAGLNQLAKAIVFAGVALMGGLLIIAVAAFQIDWFYPTFAFGTAIYIAYVNFFMEDPQKTNSRIPQEY